MTKKGRKVVFGIFKDRTKLEAGVDDLRSNGFRNTDISVLLPEKGDTQTFAHTKGTKAPEGAVLGGGAGAVVGGTIGWLVGAGIISTVPAIGPLLAAGPLMAALSGIGVGGVVGGLSGALVGLGIPEYEAKRYETYVKDGGMLLSVHVDDGDWADKAERILKLAGATDISRSKEAGPKPADQQDFSKDLNP